LLCLYANIFIFHENAASLLIRDNQQRHEGTLTNHVWVLVK
jgi:hypothetical protein